MKLIKWKVVVDLEKLYIILADKQNQDNILVNVTSSKQNMISGLLQICRRCTIVYSISKINTGLNHFYKIPKENRVLPSPDST